MKRIHLSKTFSILLFSGLIASNAKSQIYYTESENMEKVTTFYLGFENKVSFNIFEGVTDLSSPNAKILPKADDKNSFVIVPASKDSVTLNWKSKYTDGSGTEIVKDHITKFPVKLLPKAELCLGGTANEGKIDLSNLTLNYCFSEGTPAIFKSNIQVDKWVVSVPGAKKSYTGTGVELSAEAVQAIKKAKGNKKITISTVSTDKKVINGSFVK